jgi:uncharacterized membrane protein
VVLNSKPETATHKGRFDDRSMELAMGRLLQFGVLLASLVMFAGGVLFMRAHHDDAPNYRVFSSQPEMLRHLGGVMGGIRAGDPSAIIQLAVLLLIATPVARVIFALFSFAIERDKLYAAISLTVLAVLLLGLFRTH